MAATYDSFASSRFDKFIPYTPPQPRASRRAVSKELGTCDEEWTDIDDLTKNLVEHDRFPDKLAAAPLLHTLGTGSQVEEPQDVPANVEENDETGIPNDGGIHSSVTRLSLPTLSPENDAPILHTTLDEGETCVTEQHEHQLASSDTTMHPVDETILEPVTQLNQVNERLDGSSLTEAVHALQTPNERQIPDAGETIVRESERGGKPRRVSNVTANDGHVDSRDGSSFAFESVVENESPSSPENLTSNAWLSAYLSEESADEETELHQAKRARWQRKQRRLHGREDLTASTSTKRRGASHTRSNIPPKRSFQYCRKRPHPNTAADTSQSSLNYGRTGRRLVPQKLTQISLRQLASGETFMAVVIQDERKVASFAYDQAMQTIRRSVGCGQEIDKLAVMAVMLNAWVVTGLLRPVDQHNQLQTFDGTEHVIDPTNAWQRTRPSKSYTENSDPDLGPGNLLDDAGFLAPECDGAAEDDSHSSGSESDKPEVAVRRQRRHWEAFEEDILRNYAENKSWVEIGELLKRSPGGVFQHWRLMQQDKNGMGRKRKSRQTTRRCLDSDSDSDTHSSTRPGGGRKSQK